MTNSYNPHEKSFNDEEMDPEMAAESRMDRGFFTERMECVFCILASLLLVALFAVCAFLIVRGGSSEAPPTTTAKSTTKAAPPTTTVKTTKAAPPTTTAKSTTKAATPTTTVKTNTAAPPTTTAKTITKAKSNAKAKSYAKAIAPITTKAVPPTTTAKTTKAAPPTSTAKTTKAAPPTTTVKTTTAAPPNTTIAAPPSTTKAAPPTTTKAVPPTTTKAAPPTTTVKTTTAAPPTTTVKITTAAPPTTSVKTTTAAPPTTTKAAPPTTTVKTTTAAPPTTTAKTTTAAPPTTTTTVKSERRTLQPEARKLVEPVPEVANVFLNYEELVQGADRKPYNYVPLTEPKEHCGQYLQAGYDKSGVYKLSIPGFNEFYALCLMEKGTAWTVLQRRTGPTPQFWNATFNEYANGFGDPTGDHWLGLERLHAYIKNGHNLEMRILLHGDFCNDIRYCSRQGTEGFWWGDWDFRISDREDGYRMAHLHYLRGNLSNPAKDYFSEDSANQLFTTVDQDNDQNKVANCAQQNRRGGWWHKACTHIALNGQYGDTDSRSRHQSWYSWTKKSKFPFHIKPVHSMILFRVQ